MNKTPDRLFCLLFLIFIATAARAQTKVFKEVGEDIATEIKAISQDNSLVGYLAFTRLEKANADSFNYRLTVMDENLNDIGTVNFRQRNLDLQSVSFEQDVLCLGYVESSLAGMLTGKQARQAYRDGIQSQIYIQFISLSGKIIDKYSSPVTLTSSVIGTQGSFVVRMASSLKYGMQIKNISGKGFAVFYGDETKRELLIFDPGGKLLKKKKVVADVPYYLLQTSGPNIYLLTKSNADAPEGGYKIYTYATSDSVKEYSFDLKDKQGNLLKVLSFDNDPVTGKTFLAGCVINMDRTKDYINAHDYSRGPYLGVFALTLGATQGESKPTYSYWSNANLPGINEHGLFTDNDFYAKYSTAFRDFNGNTVFVGSALAEKRLLGMSKYKFGDAIFVVQDNKGGLKLESHVPCDETNYFGPAGPVNQMDHKDFYKVVNQDTRTNFIIVDDIENTYIYNVNNRKIMRTIQHKDGRIKTRVFPAKEGHILVSEYNSKEKYTRFSIESL